MYSSSQKDETYRILQLFPAYILLGHSCSLCYSRPIGLATPYAYLTCLSCFFLIHIGKLFFSSLWILSVLSKIHSPHFSFLISAIPFGLRFLRWVDSPRGSRLSFLLFIATSEDTIQNWLERRSFRHRNRLARLLCHSQSSSLLLLLWSSFSLT